MSLGRQFQPQQLRMFMSAREIQSNYQPLPGDREQVGDGWAGDRDETDEEFWDRKADESTEIDAFDRHGRETNLYDDVGERGVQKPVHLSAFTEGIMASEVARRGFAKDHVLGGHHRIAAMADQRPDDLIPVLHHRSLADAQGSPLGFSDAVQVGRPYPYS